MILRRKKRKHNEVPIRIHPFPSTLALSAASSASAYLSLIGVLREIRGCLMTSD
jgi:hypothetical protein